MIKNIAVALMGVGGGMTIAGMHNSGFLVFAFGFSTYVLDEAVVTNTRSWWIAWLITLLVVVGAIVTL